MTISGLIKEIMCQSCKKQTLCVGTLDEHLNGKKYIQWKTYRSRKKYSAYCALCQLGALDEYLNGKKQNRKLKIFRGLNSKTIGP